MSAIASGSVISPCAVHGDLPVPLRSSARRRGHQAATGPWRCRRGTAHRPAGGPRRAAAARSPAAPRPARVGAGTAAARSARLGRRRGTRRARPARGGPPRSPAGPGGRRSGRRSRPEPPGRHSAAGTVSTARTGAAALPVDERAGLLRDRRDREHDVGAVGDRAGPQLQADDERRWRPARPARAAGSGRSSGSTPPTSSASISPAAAAAMIRRCRGRAVRQRGDAPGAGDLAARGRVGRPGGRPAAGAGSAPASRRRARRPGAGPTPAGRRWPRPGGRRRTARRARRRAARRP